MIKEILTNRLDLIEMTPEFLKLSCDGDKRRAERVLGMKIDPEWYECSDFSAVRLNQFRSGETHNPWLPRAIRLRETGRMVGFIGFHLPPVCETNFRRKTAEIGYQIFSQYRRKGFAFESVAAMIEWARNSQAVTHVRASISPANLASIQLTAKLGFHKIGSQIDEVDGPEDVYELSVEKFGH